MPFVSALSVQRQDLLTHIKTPNRTLLQSALMRPDRG